MAHILFHPHVLARASGAESVAELSTWGVAELFAAVPRGLEAMLPQVASSGVWHNRILDAMKQADGSPHFLYTAAGRETALYVVCVASPGAEAALSAAQYAWAEQHPQHDVWLLPCVVQHLRADVARLAADRFVLLKSGPVWTQDDDARQFLPPTCRAPHWLGSAALFKLRHMAREAAHAGVRIYPYIAGVAHNRHLPQGVQLRCCGEAASPTVLTVLRTGGAGAPATVLWSDFYSDHNPVHELEVVSARQDTLTVLDAGGREYRASCAELHMFPERIRPRMHLRCSLNLPADSFAYLPQPERSYTQQAGVGVLLKAELLGVQRVQCCGMAGYCLQAAYDAAAPDKCLNVYVFEHLLTGKLPQAGDFVEVSGRLMLTPDALVATEACWAEPPKAAPAAPPALAPLDALAQAFADAGYQQEQPMLPLYRFGRPDLHLLTPQGDKLYVMVDFVVNDTQDHWGYRRRFYPNRYPAHMNRTPQGEGPADLCFITLHLNTAQATNSFSLRASCHGTPVEITLPQQLSYPPPPHPALQEPAAAELLCQAMESRRFDALLPYLREDLYYTSETAQITLHSKTDFLRHMRGRFDQWGKLQPPPDVRFSCAPILYQGVNRSALLAYQEAELISATLVECSGGYVSRMISLDAATVELP